MSMLEVTKGHVKSDKVSKGVKVAVILTRCSNEVSVGEKKKQKSQV